MLEILERITAGKGELADIDAHPPPGRRHAEGLALRPGAAGAFAGAVAPCATSRTSSVAHIKGTGVPGARSASR